MKTAARQSFKSVSRGFNIVAFMRECPRGGSQRGLVVIHDQDTIFKLFRHPLPEYLR
jgi:hypothetical protein